MILYYSLVQKILKEDILKVCEIRSEEELVSISFHEYSLHKCHQWKAEYN